MDLFLSILKSVIYGVIEGITEWLPISSTGHMILAEQVLKFGYTEDFMEMFRVVIQLGAILAVVVLYFHKLWPFCKDNGRDTGFAAHLRWPVVRLWFKIIVACVPAAVLGILLDDWMDAHLYNSVVVALMLIVYGVAFILIERRPRVPTTTKLSRITYPQAFKVGCWQVLSLIPGTSRSGHHSGRHAVRHVPPGCQPVHLLPCHPGHGRCQFAQAGQVLWQGQQLHAGSDRCADRWLCGCLYRFHHRHPLLDGLRQAPHLHRVRRLPHRARHCCSGDLGRTDLCAESARRRVTARRVSEIENLPAAFCASAHCSGEIFSCHFCF